MHNHRCLHQVLQTQLPHSDYNYILTLNITQNRIKGQPTFSKEQVNEMISSRSLHISSLVISNDLPTQASTMYLTIKQS